MIWVGGAIIVHGLEAYGVHSVGQAINSAAEAAAQALPSAGGLIKWTVGAVLSGIVGLSIGGVDTGNRIFRRTRMETVEGYFGRAPRKSLRFQTAHTSKFAGVSGYAELSHHLPGAAANTSIASALTSRLPRSEYYCPLGQLIIGSIADRSFVRLWRLVKR